MGEEAEGGMGEAKKGEVEGGMGGRSQGRFITKPADVMCTFSPKMRKGD